MARICLRGPPISRFVPDGFLYDVFLSHTAKDKAVACPLAERLRADCVKVWFDDWAPNPGDSIPVKIEEGLEHSRVLLLGMSANPSGSDSVNVESRRLRTDKRPLHNILDKERRFHRLQVDNTLQITPAASSLGGYSWSHS